MSPFDKNLKDSHGVTLIELLLAIVISTIIIGITYGVMITGYKTYQKIAIEGAIRDEADYIIANIMQLFYESEISDIKNCEPIDPSSPSICIEIHNTETSKISPSQHNENVSITSIDELKSEGSTITLVKIENRNVVIDNYRTKKNEDNEIIPDPTTKNSVKVNSEQFEIIEDSSKIAASCSYSTAIVADPSTGKKFIKKKCNNGIADISLIIMKKDNDDENLKLELNSQFGF